jgi:signal transduction histidine kinase
VLALTNTIQVYVVVILVGLIINLAMSLYLIRWDPRSTVNRLVAILQGLLVIWGITGLIALIFETNRVTPTTFTILQINDLFNYLGASFLGCIWLHLALLFPRRHSVTHHRWLYPLLYGPNILFYLLRLTNVRHGLFYQERLVEGQFLSIRGPLFWWFVGLSYSQLMLGVVLLIRAARRPINALQRKQATILASATLLGLGSHIVRAAFPHLLVVDPSLLVLTPCGMLYTYGVLRYRLLGLSVILNRAVVYALTYLMLGAAVFTTLSLLPPTWHTWPTWQLTLIVLAGIGLLRIAQIWLGNLIERSLNRDRQNYQQAVEEFMAQLTSVTGSDQLFPGVVDFIVETMYAENGAIIVRDQATGNYSLRYSRGLGNVAESEYLAGDPFFTFLRTLKPGDVLEQAQVMADPRYYESRDVAEERLRRWQAEVCLVLKVQDELVGVMTFGPRKGGHAYRRSDIRLFSQVARQMAISVYNVLYYDAIVTAQRQLASLNEELERRVQERTQRLEERTQELARANEELRQAQKQVVQSEKLASIGQLAAGVAHEINNPVGVILGFSQLLQRQISPDDDLLGKPLANIERESMRCKQIVQNLLDFARMDDPRPMKIDLHKILETMCQLLDYQLSQGNIKLIKEYAPELPIVIGDPQQIQQVFVNIMLNAYQAMPEGGRLKIKTWSQDDTVCVAFSDEGPGIPEEHLDHIFDPFFTTKGPGKGTGLGLSVSYGIVKRHGGHIEVTSQADQGTTFTIHLPVPSDPTTVTDQLLIDVDVRSAGSISEAPEPESAETEVSVPKASAFEASTSKGLS